MQLTITTFNLENLFTRYALIDDPLVRDNPRVAITGITSTNYQGNPLSRSLTILQRNNTARAILDCQPDILAVQEVENLWTLRLFNDQYLSGYFDRMLLIEGNDGRGIDVGLCVRKGYNAAISGIRTHMDDLDPSDSKVARVTRCFNDVTNEIQVDGALFSRDCLEVDVDVGSTPLTFLVNHLKAQDGKKASDTRRLEQATRLAEIASLTTKNGRRPIIVGDLNEALTAAPSNLKPLKDLIGKVLSDPFQSDSDNWTHFYVAGNETSRLDYILVDNRLEVSSKSILRKGITLKCATAGERYPTIGYVDTEASDHCPVTVALQLPG
jgi:endonuclease/exonuclease/phosphatase family metal-dependent hydrolase